MILYFAYGSNMKLEQMESRGKVISHTTAVLRDHRLVFNKASKKNPSEGFANVVKSEGSVVEGVLYLLDDDISELDRREGVPEHYTKEAMIVERADGTTLEALVYVANPDRTSENLLPSKEYVEKLLENKRLTKDYADLLREQQTLK